MVAVITKMFLHVTKFNYVFPGSRPSEDRTIPLSIIAERTKLTVEDVEYLLMKSLSVSPCFDNFQLKIFGITTMKPAPLAMYHIFVEL